MSPSLPYEIWKDRIENEINFLKKLDVLEENNISRSDNSVELIINLEALGFIKKGLELAPKKSHKITLHINRTFPYPNGIHFSWDSNIFHPNIHPIELLSEKKSGTGYICLNILKKWSRLSDLETTVKALKMLVENPNPDDPLNYNICLEAANFFKDNPMEKIKEDYDFEREDKDDDDIIIIDD